MSTFPLHAGMLSLGFCRPLLWRITNADTPTSGHQLGKNAKRRTYSPSMSQEQLQFNLDMAPDPARLATSFKLRPSPVIIERLLEQNPASSATSSSTELNSLDARMELASRLARRDIEGSKLCTDSWIPSEGLPNQPQNAKQRLERVREQQWCPRKKEEKKTSSQSCREAPSAAPESEKTRGLAGCSAGLHQHSNQLKKRKDELGRVRKELTRQAHRLCQLTLTRQLGQCTLPS